MGVRDMIMALLNYDYKADVKTLLDNILSEYYYPLSNDLLIATNYFTTIILIDTLCVNQDKLIKYKIVSKKSEIQEVLDSHELIKDTDYKILDNDEYVLTPNAFFKCLSDNEYIEYYGYIKDSYELYKECYNEVIERENRKKDIILEIIRAHFRSIEN